MRAEELRVIAPDRREHAEAIFDLLAKVFHDVSYYKMRDECRRVYIGNSHYDWEASRVGMIGDRVVSHYGVWDYQMRIGTSRVRVGGIGAVGTDGDVRKQGLMSRTARAALEAMRERGYDMTILFGIPDFYDRFGYVPAWHETTLFVHTWDLPKERPARPVRKLLMRPRADLAELYNRHFAAATGTAVRPTYQREFNFWGRPYQGYAWRDAQGRIRGYVLAHRRGTTLNCTEYCGDAEQALRTLGVVARRSHCETVRFEHLPQDDELCKRLRRGDCRAETHYSRSGGAMIHLLNLPQALSKMAGELSRRLRASELSGWEGKLLIAGPREEATLAVGGGRVRVAAPGRTRHAIRGGEGLARLLIGSEEPAEVIAAARMRVSGDGAQLAEALFPEQHPTLGSADRY